MVVLGIETTCDETAAAVVERPGEGRGRILSNIVLSQIDEHAAFGGVVPEIAARAHVEALDLIIAKAMAEAGRTFAHLDGVAAAAGPGLIGGVIVGLTTAKAIALVSEKPLIAVNHLEAHALTVRLTDATPFPYCLFLASGGHTQIVAVLGVGDYVRLGTTVDDAIGQAFDKIAKLLGLAYPGGPQVEREALPGDGGRFPLPRPMLGRQHADFSLSGLKTALRLEAEKIAPLSETDERALRYMDLEPGTALADIAIDRVFIGSCTNARLEDLRAAASVIQGRHVHPKVRAMVVPGSTMVKRAAEDEGLDAVFKAAGFEWRNAGCSMCLGMNPDQLKPEQRCASTSNRNFEGRQGYRGRTHLVSPQMAAAAAIAGHFVDVRTFG